MKLIKTCLPKAAAFFLFFAILTGIIYPAFMTGVAQLFFPYRANGSVLEVDGKKYSMLLGQTYTDDKYLWGRIQDFDFSIPSESEFNENSSTIPNSHGKILMYSWASNKSPAGAKFDENGNVIEQNADFDSLMNEDAAERVARIKAANPEVATLTGVPIDEVPIPVALITNSGSGLDPHIPPAAAEYQVPRIAAARGISEDEVRSIIELCTEGRTFGLFGEPIVHVLKVNLMLDGASAEDVRAGKLN